MTKETAIKLFEQKEIRSVWNEVDEKWCFLVVDIVFNRPADISGCNKLLESCAKQIGKRGN